MAAAPTYFATEAEFRGWLAEHHESAEALLVGFWKKGSGKPSIDWPQARDQALCFGWIDGLRKSLGDEAYTIRFTPRRRGSVWSKVNLARFEALKSAGQMTPAGERAFADNKARYGVYSYENAQRELTEAETEQFRASGKAWTDWEKRPPGYRRIVLHWIASAKKPETRARRLAILIEDSAAGRKIAGVDISRKR